MTVMRVSPDQDPFARARQAYLEAKKLGRLPLRWTIGHELYCRMTYYDVDWGPEARTLYGLPFDVKRDAPRDLLELDAF